MRQAGDMREARNPRRIEIRVAEVGPNASGDGQVVLRRVTDAPRGLTAVLVGAAAAVDDVFRVLAARRAALTDGYVRALDAESGSRLVERVRAEHPDEVYLVLGGHLDETVAAGAGASLLMDGVDVHLVLPETGAPPLRAAAWQAGPNTVLSLHAIGERRSWLPLRRLLDVVGASVLLVVLSPLFVAVAAVVWWRMGRPVLYAQERVGQFGRRFRLYKFRSMVVDADRMLRESTELYQRYVASNYKLTDAADGRITPLGRWLRRTSLDELPQLVNVLRGEMSLVGPRPVVPEEVVEYGDYGRMLVRVKPGLTGAWQVNGRSAVGYPERAQIDLRYVAERSLAQDLGILLRTLPAVVLRRGAL
jgi:exopolysaccharide production protein ExoY